MEVKKLSIETNTVHGATYFEEKTGALSFPIYQCATFRHPGVNQSTGYDYSRVLNPTREELEKSIALLENGSRGFAFSTGMAAISTVLSLFLPGDHILVSDDLYGGTYRMIEEIYAKNGIEFSYVNTSDLEEVCRSFRENTKGVFIETPSNPMMKVADIKAIAELAKAKGALTIVDNTFLTPYYQRPIEHGADIVVHSGTKYLGGHNDTLAGFVVVDNFEIAEKIGLLQMTTGAVLSPFDSWLLIRGIKTLSVRLEKQQSNAITIANWLKENSAVDKVYYVGLPEHEGYEINKKQSDGFGGMISFTVKDKKTAEKVLSAVKVISFAESLGGVETLITYPILQTHAAIPEEIREKLGVNDRLLRLSVGIEGIQDLLEDLEQALA